MSTGQACEKSARELDPLPAFFLVVQPAADQTVLIAGVEVMAGSAPGDPAFQDMESVEIYHPIPEMRPVLLFTLLRIPD